MQRKTNFRISVILFLIAAISAYLFIEPYLIKIEEIEINDPDIPRAFLGKKIAFISDIHFGFNYSDQRLNRLVEKINEQKPDLVLLGGDYIEKKASLAQPCFEQLKKIEAPLGIFGVLGNHDHWESAQVVQEAMSGAGIVNIDNKGFWIEYEDQKIRIGGVGDLWNDTQKIEPVIDDVLANDFLILVSHNPEYAEQLETDLVDLIVAGHHHGGQFAPFDLWTTFMKTDYGAKYKSGFVQTDKTKVFVSTGVGTTWLPIRFMARPEIVILTLQN